MKRVAILGPSGCGKTTLGRAVATKIGGEAVDLDELFWEPNWKSVSDEVFGERLEKALEAPRWVVSGNYSRMQEKFLPSADTLIWLDFPFPVVLGRLTKRTVVRVVGRKKCCNDNLETWRRTFSRNSIFLWLFKTFRRRRAHCEQIFAALENADKEKLRFSRPKQVAVWLQNLG